MDNEQNNNGWDQPMTYIDDEGKQRFVLDLTPEQIAQIKQLHASGVPLQPYVLEQLQRQGVSLDQPPRDRRRIYIHAA